MLNRSIAPPIKEIKDFSLPAAEVSLLPNKARVHYLVNATQPVVRIEVVFPAGKWYEPAKAVSFLTSKLLLEGTKTKSAKQIADILDFYGASLECNQGFDWATLTLYSLSKFVKDLLPLLTEVLQEAAFPELEFELIKKRTTQNISIERKKPAYLAMERFTEKVYGSSHPYISGLKPEDINAVNLDIVKDFFNQQYSLNGADVFVCGDVDIALKGLISEAFGELAMEVNNEGSYNHEIMPESDFPDIKMEGSLQAAVRVGKIFPLITDPDYLPLTVVNKILGGYFGSRLMKNIREDKGFTYGIYSSLSVRKHSTLFFIGTDVIATAADSTVSEIQKEIQKLAKEPIGTEELNTVKNYMIGKFLNETNNIFDQSDRYKNIVLHNLHKDHYSRYLQTIRSINNSDIQELSKKYLVNGMMITTAGAT